MLINPKQTTNKVYVPRAIISLQANKIIFEYNIYHVFLYYLCKSKSNNTKLISSNKISTSTMTDNIHEFSGTINHYELKSYILSSNVSFHVSYSDDVQINILKQQNDVSHWE